MPTNAKELLEGSKAELRYLLSIVEAQKIDRKRFGPLFDQLMQHLLCDKTEDEIGAHYLAAELHKYAGSLVGWLKRWVSPGLWIHFKNNNHTKCFG